MASGKQDQKEGRQDGEQSTVAGRQTENSRQSMKNPSGAEQLKDVQPNAGAARRREEGIGSSQGQDRSTPDLPREQGRHSSGTPDIERGGSSDSRESLVDDPTGAFKERP